MSFDAINLRQADREVARGADNASRFLAGQFGKAKLGAKVNPAADPRFRILQKRIPLPPSSPC